MVYILNETADILDMFDAMLMDNGIKVPSPEDDERDEDNEAALFGSVYYMLFDRIEEVLIDIVNKVKDGEEVVFEEWR